MEINMKSGVGEHSGSESLKKKQSVRAKEGNMIYLRELVGKIKTIERNTFRKRYGNLLNLLEVDTQVPAITALVQYYDPPLRCFTFQDFQLVPTIEEFGGILDLPIEGKIPYRHAAHNTSISALARILKIHPAELESKIITKGNSKGIPQGFLEGYLRQLADKEIGETFMDVLALTLYGVMLFPSIDNVIDFSAIDVFIAYKVNAESPVTAILADVYGNLNLCYESKRKKLLCCLPVLYIWFISHVSLDYKPTTKGAKEWACFFANLHNGMIRREVSWQQRSHVIHCGDYPNVPLIGTKCCVNYNPILAQRQFGYPIRGAPTPESLIVTWNCYEEGISIDLLRRIRSAWSNVVRAEKDSRSWVVNEKMSYQQWVMDRVKMVKLPFKPDSFPPEQLQHVESEEVKALKEELEKMKQKNVKLVDDLQKAHHEYVDLKHDNETRIKTCDLLIKKHREVRDHHFRVKLDLEAANKELALRGQEKKTVMLSEREKTTLCEELARDKREALKKLRNAQIKIKEMEQQKEKMTADFETKLDEERWYKTELENDIQYRNREFERRMEEMVSAYEARIAEESWYLTESEKENQKLVNECAELKEVAEHWRWCFSKLAAMANEAIEGVPRMLTDAEIAMPIFNPPKAIEEFLNYCRSLVREMKNIMARARN